MSNTRYLEINSTYRNREEWPLPSNFEMPISQSGRKDSTTALDPVSEASSIKTWIGSSFVANDTSITLVVTIIGVSSNNIGKASSNTTIIVTGVPGELQTIDNYYLYAIGYRNGTSQELNRIIGYKYLGNDRGEFIFENSFSNELLEGDEIQILDPSDFSTLWSPYIFVPYGYYGNNSYTNMILHNITRNESRPISDYDFYTHLLKLNCTTSSVSTNTSGPIDNWFLTDTFSIRKQKPVVCLILDGDPVNNTTTKSSFNLSSVDSVMDFKGSFLENSLSQEIDTITIAGTNSVGINNTTHSEDEYYTGCYIRMTSGLASGQIQTITSYNGSTGLVTLSPGFTVTTSVGDDYTITCPSENRRIVKYVNYTGIAVGGSLNSIEFPSSASNLSGYYNSLYIVVDNSAISPQTGIRMISDYVVTTDSSGNITSRIAYVSDDFDPIITSGMSFSITSGIVSPSFTYSISQQQMCILQFSYDNLYPFVYNGSLVSQQEMVCYELELINLILPNTTLDAGLGGLISFYPYVYVQLQNVSGTGSGIKNSIYSNNPNSTKMTFRCTIDDIPNPVVSTFIKIDGDGMTQTLKFKPNDNLKFSVHLANGEFYQNVKQEWFSPFEPNPEIQISALFSMKRIV